ncbi:MAG: DEAD/DEAH box helicase [Candidatus Thiodiazotropha sp.]
MNISLQAIEQNFSPDLVKAGRQLYERGNVSRCDIQRGGQLLTAVVKQADGAALRVYIKISEEQGLPAKSETLQRLLYLLHIREGRLSVDTCVARLLSHGVQSPCRYEWISQFKPARARGATPPRFLENIDLELLQILDRSPLDPVSQLPSLMGDQSISLFERLVATQRSYFEAIDASGPLQLGDPQNAELDWKADSFGRQCLVWQASCATTQLLPLPTPWYIELKTASCGPLQSDLPDQVWWELLKLPPLAPDQLASWWSAFKSRHTIASIPDPQLYQQHTPPAAPLQPCLRLCGSNQASGDSLKSQQYASLTFQYADFRFAPMAPDTCLRDSRLIRILRDRTAEQRAIDQLLESGFEVHDADESKGTHFIPQSTFPQTVEQAWIDFQRRILPRLREQGWRIEFDCFPHRLVESKTWTCHIDPLETTDWFALSLDVEVEGRQIDLLPLLLELLRTLPQEHHEMAQFVGHELRLPLEDRDGNACLLELDGERALHLLELLLDISRVSNLAENRPIEINRAQLARLALIDSEVSTIHPPIHWSDDEGRQLAERFKRLEQIPPCAAPSSLQATLRPYQQEGLAWLQFLREFRLAGILADDMGLGKTLQALAHLLVEKEAGRCDLPSLVVAPTSLTFNWLSEAKRFTPELKVLLLHGTQRKKRFAEVKKHDLIITTYPLLIRDREVLETQDYHLLILDEAQIIKNPKSQASRLIRGFKARHRLCLTGTPMENHLGELWSLFDFLMPGLLGDEKLFRRDFRTPIESRNDGAAAARLSRRLRPFLLRRTKQQVAKELPEKSEIIQSVVLEGAQRELYETVRLSMHRRVREEIQRQGLARSHIVVLDALMKLRQVCCDPRLLKRFNDKPACESAKLSHLMSLLEEMVEEGRCILLFSQFTSMLDLIESEVKQAGIDYLKLTGQTRDRKTVVERFQRGEVPLFLISLKAGGVGLNLTAADTVIHYDPWWNPAVERQATDRSHRIGQQQKVFVYKLICEGTLEEKILAMQQSKQRLADGLYEANNSQQPQWNEADIETLLGPLQTEDEIVT